MATPACGYLGAAFKAHGPPAQEARPPQHLEKVSMSETSMLPATEHVSVRGEHKHHAVRQNKVGRNAGQLVEVTRDD